jgi:protein-tyrosine phosphatase
VSLWFRSYGFADVHPDFVIGAYPLDEEDVTMLGHLNVDRILNLVEESEYRPGERDAVLAALANAGIQEQRLDLIDFGSLAPEALEAAVAQVITWLDEGHRVYLHCRAGWQRSAAIAAGVVAIREGRGIEEALDVVQLRKPSADPLPHQREDLAAWWADRTGAERSDGDSGPDGDSAPHGDSRPDGDSGPHGDSRPDEHTRP